MAFSLSLPPSLLKGLTTGRVGGAIIGNYSQRGVTTWAIRAHPDVRLFKVF